MRSAIVHNSFALFFTAVVAALALAACSSGGGGGGGGGDGGSSSGGPPALTGNPSTIVAESLLAPGVECPAGGLRVDSGIDVDGDGELDSGEIDDSEVVCNGEGSLVARTPLKAGDECLYGGSRLDVGRDADGDGALDAAEISASQVFCATRAQAFDGPVFLADLRLDFMYELYSVNADGSGLQRRASPPIRTGFVWPAAIAPIDRNNIAISPDRRHVAFVMKNSLTAPRELYVASLLDGSPPTRVSGPMVAGGFVQAFRWSPDGRRLAYMANQDDVAVVDLYTVFADGTHLTKVSGPMVAGGNVNEFGVLAAVLAYLGRPLATIGGFAWSPDSTRLAYIADQDTDTVAELYSVAADGRELRKVNGPLVANGNVGMYDWAPDGSRLAYVADQDIDEVRELFTVLPDGSGRIKVNTPLGLGRLVVYFNWAPDGSRLAYTSNQDLPTTIDLFTVLPDGSERTRVNDRGTGASVGYFDWSPDSQRLAYAGNDLSSEQLYSVHFDGTEHVRVNGPLVTGGNVRRFRWSPDGARLAYQADQDVDEQFELYTAFADGDGMTKVNSPLSPSADVSTFEWAPNNSRLAYRANQDSSAQVELYTVFPDGSANTKVNGPLVSGGNVELPPLAVAETFMWSPDGTRLGYVADEEVNEVFNFYTVRADGTNRVKVTDATIAGKTAWEFTW